MSRLLPSRADLGDAMILAALGGLALLGFRTTYAGSSFVVVGCAALGAGMLLSHILHALRQPVIVLAASVLVAFFVMGGPLVLPHEPWFSLDTCRSLAAASVFGWKRLLTSLPPVEADGVLLVVPYLLGLVCGAAGFTLAQRLGRVTGRGHMGRGRTLSQAIAPVLAPAIMLGLVLAFGTREPGAQLLDGVGFATICLMWTIWRLRRLRPATRHTSRPFARTAAAGGVLAGAAVAAMLVGPHVPGAAVDRAVLRDHIVPPLDLRSYPSPLVGFRKYTKDANRLWDQPLFTVTGLPAGQSIRIATLDDYDGAVWGATNGAGFQPAGAHVDIPDGGQATTVHIVISAAYASANDVNAWLPQAGTVTQVSFGGPRGQVLTASLRYNHELSAGIVSARLRNGDRYTLRTVVTSPTLPADAQPFGRPALSESAQALLSSKVASWTKDAVSLPARLAAAAAYLHNNGAFSDGGPGETQYLPGHGIGRLSAFLQGPIPVGDDEQYAAAYSLIANYLGVPARVVLGAKPDANGVVRGRDVHAWVEVHLAGGAWTSIPQTEFMPDPSKRPNHQPPQDAVNEDAEVVPPPNAIHLPTTPIDASREDLTSQRSGGSPIWRLIWAYLRPYLVWGGPPVIAVLMAAVSIVGVKARRRRRRRQGGAANRYAGGWRELVDCARDLGVTTVLSGMTRREEANALDRTEILHTYTFGRLAAAADMVVYGPDDPSDQEAKAYWAQIDKARRDMTSGLSRARRLRVALSFRSFRSPGRTKAALPGGGIA